MPEMTDAPLTRLRAEVINSKQIPTIPAVLVKILEVVGGERTGVKDLVAVVERDKVLTGRILRLANSAFFGFSRNVSTLSRAVMLLGFSMVKNLALGVKVWESLTGGRAHGEMEKLWVHSSLVAAGSRALARRLKLPDPEEAFTAGLLHDIGKVILFTRFPSQYGEILGKWTGDEGVVAERGALGVDHAQVGGWLAESWSLPALIVEAASGHHRSLEDSSRWDLSGVVNLANRLVNATSLDQTEVSEEVQSLLRDLRDPLLDAATWAEITEQLRAQEAEVRNFFSPVEGE